MKLYHGSTMTIEIPHADIGRAKLDFGKGFYVTTKSEQAEEWLFFVSDNRRSDYPAITHGYDIIFGHIADDRVIETIDYFIEQLIAKNGSKNLVNLTIEQLMKQTPNDQYCFTNDRVLKELTYVSSYEASL